MKTETNTPDKNNLLRARRASGLEGKQVAFLLGRRSADEIYRYENGIHLPKLKALLKLEIIYQTPIKLLFQELFERCLEEISVLRKQRPLSLPNHSKLPKSAELLKGEESCFYANLLQSHIPNELELQTVRKHVINLTNTISDFLNDRHPFS